MPAGGSDRGQSRPNASTDSFKDDIQVTFTGDGASNARTGFLQMDFEIVCREQMKTTGAEDWLSFEAIGWLLCGPG